MAGNEQQFDVVVRRLKGIEFDPLRVFLNGWMTDKLDELSRSEEPVAIYRLQGEIKALRRFLSLVTEKRG